MRTISIPLIVMGQRMNTVRLKTSNLLRISLAARAVAQGSIRRTLVALSGLALAGVLLALWPDPADAATFAVNRTGDGKDRNIGDSVCDTALRRGKQCSLRAAIQEANDTLGPDTINFNIGGTGPVKPISPTSPLPTITDPLTIDGYTQPGAKPPAACSRLW